MKNKRIIFLGIILTFLFMVKAKPTSAIITYNERIRLEQIAINIETYGRDIYTNGYIECNDNAFFNQIIVSPADIHFVSDLYQREERGKPLLRSIQIPNEGVHIIGDLHGQLLPTIRQLQAAKQDHAIALLTGDLRDRGKNSLEVMIYTYVQHLLDPDHVIILLGNHDWDYLGLPQYDFYFSTDLNTKYGSSQIANDIFQQDMLNIINYLPWAAELRKHDGSQKYFCAHGGIGPTLQNQFSLLQNFNSPAPIDLFNSANPTTDPRWNTQMQTLNDILIELTWDDPPWDNTPYNGASFINNTHRGIGYCFNATGFHTFCTTHHFIGMFAGHRHTRHYAQLRTC